MQKKASLIFLIIKDYIHSEILKKECRMNLKSFVRTRVLTFPTLILFLVNLAKKSLQVSLDNFFNVINLPSITKQAFSKARKNLSPRAFLLLNSKLLEEYYTDNEYSTWKGFRIIAIDGSDIQLPQKESLKLKFGCAKNDKGSTLAMAKLSCAYDVLNHKTLDAQVNKCKSSERDLAVEHIAAIEKLNLATKVQTKDLYLFDRGYPSLGLLFFLITQNQDFIMRTSLISCFSPIKQAMENGEKDVIVRFSASQVTPQQRMELKKRIPNINFSTAYIDVRVVLVMLNDGKEELLITSLLDKEKYPRNELKALYGLRWRKEENYKWFKIGMELENFSGHSDLAIEQEVFATVFTANLASLLMEEAQAEIEKEHQTKKLKHQYKINKRIAVGNLRDQLVEALLDPNIDLESFCNNLKDRFKKNLCPLRDGRKFKRPKKGRRTYGCTLRKCV